MKRILGEIQSGDFAREWIAENRAGQENFKRLRAEQADTQVEHDRQGAALPHGLDQAELLAGGRRLARHASRPAALLGPPLAQGSPWRSWLRRGRRPRHPGGTATAARAAASAPGPRRVPRRPGFTCATLRVPLDRARPGGTRLALRVAVQRRPGAARRARRARGRPGPARRALRARPRARLGAAARGWRARAWSTSAAPARAPALPGAAARRGHVGPHGPARARRDRLRPPLGARRTHFTTADTVADLDDLRRALRGAAAVAASASSYGTFVAERYALAHPRPDRRLVLDSVVPHAGVVATAPRRCAPPAGCCARSAGAALPGRSRRRPAVVVRRDRLGVELYDALDRAASARRAPRGPGAAPRGARRRPGAAAGARRAVHPAPSARPPASSARACTPRRCAPSRASRGRSTCPSPGRPPPLARARARRWAAARARRRPSTPPPRRATGSSPSAARGRPSRARRRSAARPPARAGAAAGRRPRPLHAAGLGARGGRRGPRAVASWSRGAAATACCARSGGAPSAGRSCASCRPASRARPGRRYPRRTSRRAAGTAGSGVPAGAGGDALDDRAGRHVRGHDRADADAGARPDGDAPQDHRGRCRGARRGRSARRP